MKNLLFFVALLPLFWSCGTKKNLTSTAPETEYRNLDTLTVTSPRSVTGVPTTPDILTLPPYNPSHKRESDLLHTKLDLRFNWEKEQVLGKATLTLKPYFYATDRVTLDAKGFEFYKVTFEGSNENLPYTYDGKQIVISLGKTFTRDQSFKLVIDYVATPAASGGSAAITSDKGLFFINPRGEEGDKPRQIWTQGETENNSRWFPTIDKPNERCTQEMLLTVEDHFKTLSNGLLISSTKNPDGTRTDYWRMDQPHAPYLFMIAIGDYAVVNDTWNGKPVSYYVEPKYEQHARSIFPHTPEMLSFFSSRLGVPYPWQKYSQVVVRDYVSGAMENTTAVIFGEFMQATQRNLIDNLQNEKIVAHEMFHHWFGDLVTCESWANLTLNEGFANYSEYLWLEHKYGRDEADFHLFQELNGYLQAARNGVRPIIHFGYEDKEDMFDAHSYNKGGLVLHMLRHYVGDDAFFAALKKYLNDNAYTDVEGHELRLAFEDVTGEDLNWFFNQWFYKEGHPQLKLEYDYDEEHQRVSVSVEQTQTPETMQPVFELPVAIDVYEGEKMTRHMVRVNERKQTFTFDAVREPDLVVFDGEGMLLAEKDENKSADEYLYQAEHAPNFLHRVEALVFLSDAGDERAVPLFRKALTDKFWLVRVFAIDQVDLDADTEAIISNLAEKDPHSSVREAALLKLAYSGEKKYVPVATQVIEKDPSLKVVTAGLNALQELDKEAALMAAKKLENEDEDEIILALAAIYAQSGDPAHLGYFDKKLNQVGGFAQFTFLEHYAELAAQADAGRMLQSAQRLKQLAMDASKFYWFRYMATNSINSLHAALSDRLEQTPDPAAQAELKASDAKIIAIIEEIKAWEKEEQLQEMYEQFPNPPVKP